MERHLRIKNEVVWPSKWINGFWAAGVRVFLEVVVVILVVISEVICISFVLEHIK